MNISARRTMLIMSLAAAVAAALSACSTTPSETAYAGFVRRQDNVFLMENHCHSLVAWHMIGARNATVIHVDTHDDCRPVSAEKLASIKALLEKEAYSELFARSDTGRFLDMKVKDADMLYDLGNFIYPALKLGLVSNVYWVVPQPSIGSAQRSDLVALTQVILPGSSASAKTYPAGGFAVNWEGRTMHVLTLEDLPVMPEGCILDLDIDFFAFPRAMTDEHLVAQVNRNPEDVFRYLQHRVPNPAATTISASVWGGYLPLLLRFLADAAYDFYTTGEFPDDANHLLKAYKDIRQGRASPPAAAANASYRAASCHFTGLTYLAAGDTDACEIAILQASALLPVYRKGLLDAAEALTSMNRYSDARHFIDLFRKQNDGQSYNSLATGTLLSLASGDTNAALNASSQLTAWDSNPYTLLIHGSALSANGNTAAARSTFERLLEKDPRNSAAYFNIGALKQASGDIDGSVKDYSMAIATRPDFWQAHENLGHILLEQGQLDRAGLLLTRALEINPFSVTSANNLGLVMARQGKFDRAIEIFGAGLEMNPNNTTLKINLAEALLLTGEYGKARQLCMDVLAGGDSPKAQELINQIKKKVGEPQGN